MEIIEQETSRTRDRDREAAEATESVLALIGCNGPKKEKDIEVGESVVDYLRLTR